MIGVCRQVSQPMGSDPVVGWLRLNGQTPQTNPYGLANTQRLRRAARLRSGMAWLRRALMVCST